MATVCSVCQAVNRDSAKFCKGCAGRLPAFYGAGVPVDTGFGVTGPAVLSGAGGGAATADASDFRAHARALLEPATRAFGASAMWLALALVLLFAVFVIWYVAHVSGRPTAAAVLQPPAAVAAPAALVAPAAAAQARDVPAEQEPLTAAEAVILAEPPVKAAPTPRPYVPDYQPAAPREAPLPAPPPARAAVEAPQPTSTGPLAGCMSLNFFAKAICMNNRCAQPANAGHPQCAEVLRQRRLDEARRNPTMIN